MPDHFNSWSEFENYIKLLVDLKCIDDARKIWWDVRPHPPFGTLEFRVCDVPTRPADAVMLGALCQAIIVKLHKLYTSNMGFRLYRRALIEENKWRAARWGMDGKLIDFGRRLEVPMRELALELLEFVDDVVDPLGSREAVNQVHSDAARGDQRRPAARGVPADGGHADGHAAPDRRDHARHGKVRGVAMKIGLMCGREYSFPPAFIERVNQIGAEGRHHRGDGCRSAARRWTSRPATGSSSIASRTRWSTTAAR